MGLPDGGTHVEPGGGIHAEVREEVRTGSTTDTIRENPAGVGTTPIPTRRTKDESDALLYDVVSVDDVIMLLVGNKCYGFSLQKAKVDQTWSSLVKRQKASVLGKLPSRFNLKSLTPG